MGLGYVNGVREAEVRRLVEERERNGPWRGVEDLASRSGANADSLTRLAWAGACDSLLSGPLLSRRRHALWLLGVAAPGEEIPAGTQLALPLETGAPPGLPELGLWERMLADYGSTGVTLREHPLELMRPVLGERYVSSADLDRTRDGAPVTVAGLVVARQRPATAKGVTFMLLEDEHGSINLVIPPPVFDANRATIRGEPLLAAEGRLERREGVTNIVVDRLWRLERPDLPQAEVRQIEPRRAWSTQEEADDLRAVAPAGHSFGRRGR